MNFLIFQKFLSLQTNYLKFKNSKFRFLNQMLFFNFFLLILINQTTSTYTNSFIDHKTLISPKQLISNTLKQTFKPKFNPRFQSSSKDKVQKLNVYDLSGDVKSARKHQSSKEQVPQSTYYYTDYKPIIKNLVPMQPPYCPETGRTVCKNAKEYPIDSILNLILEVKANNFNFSSLFIDESQNSDQPNLPDLESTISKNCQNDEKTTPDYNEEKEKENGKNYKLKTNEDNKNYEGAVKTSTNYKRPGDSYVYYDNENYVSTPSQNNHLNNNYEPQRIVNDDAREDGKDGKDKKIFNNQKEKLIESPKSTDHKSADQFNPDKYSQPSDQQQFNQQYKQTYNQELPIKQSQQNQQYQQQLYQPQQPQSSIKFEQQYQQNKLTRQPNYRVNTKPIQDLSYRNSDQNNYYHTNRKDNHHLNTPPYKTTVTIIPFIQYITQLPTNDYQISSNKQLLDTISQSLRHTPLNDYSPDTWLPIKGYSNDLQQKEIDDHLSTDQLSTSANENLTNEELANAEYSPNYRDKRSTCTDENKKDKNENLNKKNDEKSLIKRVKKQAGFDEEPEELCQTRRLYITPKAALNDKSEWRYIVNVGERDSRLKQVIKVDVCASPNGECSNKISLPFGYVGKCKQKYIKKKLLAIDPNGSSTSTESFFIPSCCVCEINRAN